MSAEIGVSKTAVYDKLNRLEPSVSRALVKSTAIDLARIIHQLGVERPGLLPGSRVKILDGNGLGATEHRLEVLRNNSSGALPGKSLVVLDQALGLAIDIFPCEDGHACIAFLVTGGVRNRRTWGLMDRRPKFLHHRFGVWD